MLDSSVVPEYGPDRHVELPPGGPLSAYSGSWRVLGLKVHDNGQLSYVLGSEEGDVLEWAVEHQDELTPIGQSTEEADEGEPVRGMVFDRLFELPRGAALLLVREIIRSIQLDPVVLSSLLGPSPGGRYARRVEALLFAKNWFEVRNAAAQFRYLHGRGMKPKLELAGARLRKWAEAAGVPAPSRVLGAVLTGFFLGP